MSTDCERSLAFKKSILLQNVEHSALIPCFDFVVKLNNKIFKLKA